MVFSILGIDHVTVGVPEELCDEVVSWYTSCLGLEQVEKPDHVRTSGIWLRAGDHEVHIALDPHNPPKTAHFALVVDDFDHAVEGLRGSGCHIEQAEDIPGRRRFFTRDPAGNGIEVVCLRTDGAA